jgi:hypothetical protein
MEMEATIQPYANGTVKEPRLVPRPLTPAEYRGLVPTPVWCDLSQMIVPVTLIRKCAVPKHGSLAYHDSYRDTPKR